MDILNSLWTTQRLKYVLISPSQNNLKWQSNKLTHLLACHLQRHDGTYGQLNYFQQRVCTRQEKCGPALTQLALITTLSSLRLQGTSFSEEGWSYSNWDTTTPDGETVHSVALKKSVEAWRLTPTGSRAGCKWRSRLRMSSTSWQTNETSCLCSSSIVAKF